MKKQPYCRLPLAEPSVPTQTILIALIVGVVFGLAIMLIVVSL